MNREILFRAKKVDGGEWVEGYVVKKHGAYFIYDINNSDACRQNNYLIEEDTICQYTELTDKNGKKIFEGDILRGFQYPFCHDGEYNYYAEIIFANCSFMTYTRKNPSSCVRGISDGNTELMECWISEDWEVIGNIYDNPELLEEEKEHGTN